MGILDNFQGYANVNPNVAGIAQNLQTSLNSQTQKQRTNQLDWINKLASIYLPASQGYRNTLQTNYTESQPVSEQTETTATQGGK